MRALNVGQASRGIASRDRSRAVAESATSLNGLAARLSDELAVCVEIFDASAGTLRSPVSELTRAALEEDNADARNLTGILEDCETLLLVTIPCALREQTMASPGAALCATGAESQFLARIISQWSDSALYGAAQLRPLARRLERLSQRIEGYTAALPRHPSTIRRPSLTAWINLLMAGIIATLFVLILTLCLADLLTGHSTARGATLISGLGFSIIVQASGAFMLIRGQVSPGHP